MPSGRNIGSRPRHEAFASLFEEMRADLAAHRRETRRFERKSEIEPGRFYILGGQMLLVASTEAAFTDPHGNINARLRVIYDNGTESNLLLRTLQRSLQQDPAGRRIVEGNAGPLFADSVDGGDPSSGTVYVLRSLSGHPAIAPHCDLLHKIGVTSGDVRGRIAQARGDLTFLMADVEVVATYELYGIRQSRFETLIHRIFGAARLDADVTDRFGVAVNPREWFLVPLPVIDEAITLIRDGRARTWSTIHRRSGSQSTRARSPVEAAQPRGLRRREFAVIRGALVRGHDHGGPMPGAIQHEGASTVLFSTRAPHPASAPYAIQRLGGIVQRTVYYPTPPSGLTS